jgi:UDP-N-acetyl-D-glucosamine dehydrogenase
MMTMVLEQIRARSSVVGIIGLGYVGLPLAVLQAKTGYSVIGFDASSHKVELVNRGESYISDVGNEELCDAAQTGRLTATQDFGRLQECDIVLICVPTPLTKQKEPDLTAVVSVTKQLAQRVRPGMLIVLESTTYPGTTEEVLQPILTASGLKVGHDLFVAFSPERVDPGNRSFKTQNTYKLVGGVTSACLTVAKTFYEQSIVKIFPVSSPRVAEMTKVFENVFRSVNIALVNELAVLCDRMGLNVYEVIDAASTKNFGFMPFYHSPGPLLPGMEIEGVRSAHALHRIGRRDQRKHAVLRGFQAAANAQSSGKMSQRSPDRGVGRYLQGRCGGPA